jgi:hypothetical protein
LLYSSHTWGYNSAALGRVADMQHVVAMTLVAVAFEALLY